MKGIGVDALFKDRFRDKPTSMLLIFKMREIIYAHTQTRTHTYIYIYLIHRRRGKRERRKRVTDKPKRAMAESLSDAHCCRGVYPSDAFHCRCIFVPARGIQVKVRVRSAPRTFLFPSFSRATPSSSTSLTMTTTIALERRIFRPEIFDRQSRHLPDGNHRKRPTSGLRRSPPPFFFSSSPRTPTLRAGERDRSTWIVLGSARALLRNSYPFFVSPGAFTCHRCRRSRPFRHVSSRPIFLALLRVSPRVRAGSRRAERLPSVGGH